jgi:hypothetical protein
VVVCHVMGQALGSSGVRSPSLVGTSAMAVSIIPCVSLRSSLVKSSTMFA